jgi:hypothetical protein
MEVYMLGQRAKWISAFLLVGSLVTAHLVLTTARVSACSPPNCWYAGYYETGYGLQGYIAAPSSLTLANWPAGATQTNWFSTDETPTWMQTGWYYDAGGFVTVPWSYVEYCINPCVPGSGDRYWMWGPSQGWNNTVWYEVEYDPSHGASAWCAYINSIQIWCQDNIKVGPTSMQTYSEIHNSGFTPLNTHFSSLLIKYTSYTWHGQSLSNMFHNPPYQTELGSQYVEFRTYRGATYLPYVMRG